MNWAPTRLRYVADLNPAIRADVLQDLTREVSFLPMDAIGEDGSLNLERTRPVGDVKSGYSYFENGDVTFAKVTPCFENGKGAIMSNLTGAVGFGTTEITVLRPHEGMDARFLRYFLASAEFMAEAAGAMTGAGGLKRVPDWFVRDYPAKWPDSGTQVNIADFLDEQTARIDTLIAEKADLRGKLSEYLYSQASSLMTQGLQPGVKLQKTSFPELGSIPAHWGVKRLKVLGEVRSGVAKGKDIGARPTVSLPYLRVANVQDGYVDLTEVHNIEVAESDAERYLLRKGDVLMNEGGDNDKLGRGTVWQGQIEPCIHQNHVFAVRMDDLELADWVARFTSTDAARCYFFLRSKQSTNLASINHSNVRELPVPMPPPEERSAILERVRSNGARINELMQHAERHIERLREYRSSLISAAVTGELALDTQKTRRVERLAA